MTVNGTVKADAGNIGEFIIDNGHLYTGDITAFGQPKVEPPLPPAEGVYIGPDGIRLGDKFTVDDKGVVTAEGLIIDLTPEQIEQLKGRSLIPSLTNDFTTVPYDAFGAIYPDFVWSAITTTMQVFLNGDDDSEN